MEDLSKVLLLQRRVSAETAGWSCSAGTTLRSFQLSYLLPATTVHIITLLTMITTKDSADSKSSQAQSQSSRASERAESSNTESHPAVADAVPSYSEATTAVPQSGDTLSAVENDGNFMAQPTQTGMNTGPSTVSEPNRSAPPDVQQPLIPSSRNHYEHSHTNERELSSRVFRRFFGAFAYAFLLWILLTALTGGVTEMAIHDGQDARGDHGHRRHHSALIWLLQLMFCPQATQP